MDEARKLLDGVQFCNGAYDAMDGADALVIVTEWNEFRALDLKRVKSLLRSPTVIDLRNIYKPTDMAEAGFYYFSIGRRSVEPAHGEQRVRAQG
jgi:UDPglucose 6-dehydrogenase